MQGKVIELIKWIESQKVDVGQNEREMFPLDPEIDSGEPGEAVQPKLPVLLFWLDWLGNKQIHGGLFRPTIWVRKLSFKSHREIC